MLQSDEPNFLSVPRAARFFVRRVRKGIFAGLDGNSSDFVPAADSSAARMNYPQYRREGLPVTSATVESLIKQFNQRVKGTGKFRLRGGAEAVLQVRAAYLSDDGRGEEFHHHRPRGHAVGRNRLRLNASTVMHPR